MTRFDLSSVFDAVARAVPDQEVLVRGELRLTYRELNERATGLAHHLAARGLGCRAPRDSLAGHESGQSHLALYLRNGNEYLEGMLAGFRARAAPLNINYRYVADELRHVLRDAQPSALIYHAEFAPQVAAIREDVPGLDVLVQVADSTGNELLPGAVDYESAVVAPAEPLPTPSGEDLYILYTGGTTGLPKGVLWRQHDIYLAAMGGRGFGSEEPFASYEEIASAAVDAGGGVVLLMTAPFVHGAAQWSAFHVLTLGGKLVLPRDNAQLDWAEILSAVEREGVVSIPVVGDAMARPLLDELDRGQHDLSGLAAVSNGGAPLTPGVRARLLEALPHVTLLDAVGSSETGYQMNHVSVSGDEADTGVFAPDSTTTVLDDALRRELGPGEGEGWLASRGRVPLGYLGDADKTERTFPVVGGQRCSVPGDRAMQLDDGRIELLGRDGLTINSGGEKIFAEEVERALTAHPDVRDVLVVGKPSERWGEEVVALVQLCPSSAATDEDLLTCCSRHVARYKVPKSVVRCPQIRRYPSGKADYRWARNHVEAT